MAKVRATTSFACEVNGKDVVIHAGEEFDSKHEAVKARPELFEAEQAERRPERGEPSETRGRSPTGSPGASSSGVGPVWRVSQLGPSFRLRPQLG